MLVVVAYDVSTQDPEGKKRLRKVAKHCVNYGQRVQNSVFECIITTGEFRQFEDDLLKLIDKNKDSIRIYYLGKNFEDKVKHFGAKPTIDLSAPLIF